MSRGPLAAPIAAALLLGLAAVLVPGALRAQGWVLDASAGRVDYRSLPSASSATNAMLGLRWHSGTAWLRLVGGVPLTRDDPIWTSGGGGGRLGLGTGLLRAGIDATAFGSLHRDPAFDAGGSSIAFEGIPFVGVGSGSVGLEAGVGWSGYAGRFGDGSWSRSLELVELRLTATPFPRTRLDARFRGARAAEEDYPFVGVSALHQVGPGTFWASVGRWAADTLGGTSWSLGASTGLGGRTDVWASVRRDATDPLYRAPALVSWAIGVSRRIGPAPPPTPGARVASGTATILLSTADAPEGAAIAGDFNGWSPAPMERQGPVWVVRLRLEPGVYHFAFRTPDGEWFVPEGYPGRQTDGMGGWMVVLVVPG